MTDEQRLGLPEEPDFYADKCGTRCNTDAAKCSYDFDRCAEYHDAKAWGAAWREKALELEKERDELLQKLRELEMRPAIPCCGNCVHGQAYNINGKIVCNSSGCNAVTNKGEMDICSKWDYKRNHNKE